MSSWLELDLTEMRPPVRGGHSCCALEAALNPQSSGSVQEIEDDQQPTTTSANVKEQPSTVVVIFGGADPFGITYNDVYAVKVAAHASADKKKLACPVKHLQANGASCGPKPRSGHSCVPVPPKSGGDDEATPFQEFVIFGGMAPLPEVVQFDDVWIMGIHRGCCDLPATDKKGRPLNTLIHWAQPPTSGKAPCARNDHSCAVLDNDMLVVGGSSAAHGGPLGDVHVLSLDTFAWREVTMPSSFLPREMAAFTAISADTGLVIGGRGVVGGQPDILADGWFVKHVSSTEEIKEKDTTTFTQCGTRFPQRCCHTVSFHATSSKALVAGGFSTGALNMDVTVSLSSSEASEIIVESAAEDAPRTKVNPSGGGQELLLGFGHSSTELNNRVFVVGGIQVNDIGSSLQVFELQQ